MSTPSMPVIFIHGLAGSALTWQELSGRLVGDGWQFGGVAAYDPGTGLVSPLTAGDFYVVAFSNNQELTLDEQGAELEQIVDAVLLANPTQARVTLVGHSMGGLAGRAFLQFRYDGNVFQYISIGTPHLGAAAAVGLQDACDSGPLGLLCQLLSGGLGIDPFSIAVEELKPASPALAVLNDLGSFPLPGDIHYTSIVGEGTPVVTTDEPGDGVVSVQEQRLSNVAGFGNTSYHEITLNIEDRASCDPGFTDSPLGDINPLPNITHMCETSDTGVADAVLWTILRGAPGATELVLSQSALVPGQNATLQASGAQPGETVFFGVSTLGAQDDGGPCPPAFGGECLDILSPKLIGQAVADATGTATITPLIPGGAPSGKAVFTQAAIPRSVVTVKSNTVSSTIQ